MNQLGKNGKALIKQRGDECEKRCYKAGKEVINGTFRGIEIATDIGVSDECILLRVN